MTKFTMPAPFHGSVPRERITDEFLCVFTRMHPESTSTCRRILAGLDFDSAQPSRTGVSVLQGSTCVAEIRRSYVTIIETGIRLPITWTFFDSEAPVCGYCGLQTAVSTGRCEDCDSGSYGAGW